MRKPTPTHTHIYSSSDHICTVAYVYPDIYFSDHICTMHVCTHIHTTHKKIEKKLKVSYKTILPRHF